MLRDYAKRVYDNSGEDNIFFLAGGLAYVFDIEQERGVLAGKIFDIQITVLSTLLLVAYSGLSAYLAIATSRGVQVLQGIGVRRDVMGAFEYWVGRAVAFAFIVTLF